MSEATTQTTVPVENFDHYLRLQVIDKRLSLVDVDAAEIVSDNRGNVCVHIEFDEHWDGVGKTARFIYNGMWIDAVLNAKNECVCPSEVVKKGRFFVGVYGGELKTTTPLAVSVAASILSESGEELPADPTPGQYEQIMKVYADTTRAADEATEAVWSAVNAANDATKALNDAKDELENGGFITSIKEKNKGTNLSFWVGTTEEYEALMDKPSNCYVIITDDDTLQRLEQLSQNITNKAAALEKEIDDGLAAVNQKSQEVDEAVEDMQNEISALTSSIKKVFYDADDNEGKMLNFGAGKTKTCQGISDYSLFLIDGVVCSRYSNEIRGTSSDRFYSETVDEYTTHFRTIRLAINESTLSAVSSAIPVNSYTDIVTTTGVITATHDQYISTIIGIC